MDDRADDTKELRERYDELLAELRTIIPGVQVLFAFLLTVPFNRRFENLDDLGVQLFTVALIAVSLATVVLMTPAAYHRVAPRHNRRQRLTLGVRVTVAGMSLLAVSIGAAVFVVGRLIFAGETAAPATTLSPTTIAAAIAAVVAGAAVLLWFVVPLLHRDADPSARSGPPPT